MSDVWQPIALPALGEVAAATDVAGARGPDLWSLALDHLRTTTRRSIVESWFEKIAVVHTTDTAIHLGVPDHHFRDYIEAHHLDAIRSCLQALTDRPIAVQFELLQETMAPSSGRQRHQHARSPTPQLSMQAALFDAAPSGIEVRAAPEHTSLPRFTLDAFVVGISNQLAASAARAVAETPGQTFNPLFIYGGVGIGKTHLLHAIGHAARTRHPELRVRYVPAETFIEDTIRAMRSKEPSARSVVRDLYRDGVDMLLIDDIQFLQGKDKTQEEFFHTFNALHQAGKQVVLTSDRFPSELQQFHDRLRSRFDWGLVAEIAPPDRDLRCAILRKKVQEAGLEVKPEVISYLAEHLRNNVRELEGALNKLSAHQKLHSQAQGRPVSIDLALARSVLGALIELPSRQLSAELIQRATAQHFGLKVTDLKGARRHRNVVVPRMIATHLIRKHTPLSFPDIGRAFGGRDHSTAIHACQKVEWMLQTDPSVQAAVQAIETALGK